jgi:hypothetical protein
VLLHLHQMVCVPSWGMRQYNGTGRHKGDRCKAAHPHELCKAKPARDPCLEQSTSARIVSVSRDLLEADKIAPCCTGAGIGKIRVLVYDAAATCNLVGQRAMHC